MSRIKSTGPPRLEGITIKGLFPESGKTPASPSNMPPTQLTMSLCSRQRDALKRLLQDEGIDDQPHQDLDSLLHILLVRMQQEGWSIDARGRLMTPEQTENAKRAARRRSEDTGNSANDRDLKRENNSSSQGVDGRRYIRDSQATASPYGDIDKLPRPHPLVALPPPPLFRVGNDRVRPGMPRGYTPYMERGSAYQSQYQDSKKDKHSSIGGKVREEADDDPHYIGEDAVFEFWLANIWRPVNQGMVTEERGEVVCRKKGWFRALWDGKK